MLVTSREALKHQGWAGVRAGVPAGFLIAAVAWSLPAGRRQEFLIVLFFTYFISFGGFAHVVAGSCEAWLLWVSGEIGFGTAAGGLILPALLGNILGGTLMFALLAHAQVRQEL
jgi:formate/nitrite transporter FocA (FNT family)